MGLDNATMMRIELDIQAQHMISQLIINNTKVEEDLKKGIKNAFDNFDFVKATEEIITKALDDAIREQTRYGNIRKNINDKVEALMEEIVTKNFNKIIKKLAKDIDVSS